MADRRNNLPSQEKAEKAVAIQYDRQTHTAPVITAKGKGELAKQILEIAFANGIKVRTDEDLVELLEAFEVESQIPVEAFAAVAEILNYLYQLNGSEKPKITPDFLDETTAPNPTDNKEKSP